MKTIVIISISALCIAFFSCSQKNNAELIVGKWKYDHLELPQAMDVTEMTEKDKIGLAVAGSMISSITLEYFTDKTFEMSMPGLGKGSLSGTYELINVGKYIQTSSTEPGETEPLTDKQEITLLTTDSMKLKNTPEGLVMVYNRLK